MAEEPTKKQPKKVTVTVTETAKGGLREQGERYLPGDKFDTTPERKAALGKFVK